MVFRLYGVVADLAGCRLRDRGNNIERRRKRKITEGVRGKADEENEREGKRTCPY